MARCTSELANKQSLLGNLGSYMYFKYSVRVTFDFPVKIAFCLDDYFDQVHGLERGVARLDTEYSRALERVGVMSEHLKNVTQELQHTKV